MSLTNYILNGRDVPKSDVILELTLALNAILSAATLVENNLSRIDETDDVKEKIPSAFKRTARSRTPPLVQPTVVLTFSDPPAQSRPYFTIGYDPASCDVVCADPAVDDVHFKLALEGDHVVLYDVSSSGSHITLDDRGTHQTYPKPGAPYRCILPLDCRVTLKFPGHEFIIRIPSRNLAEADDYCQNRDAFLSHRSGGPAPPAGLPEPSQYHGSNWRPMYWLESPLGNGAFGTVSRAHRLHDWAVFAIKELKPATTSQPSPHPNQSTTTTTTTNPPKPRRRRSSPPPIDTHTLAHELRALRRLPPHNHIIPYADWYDDGPGRGRSMLVMEYCAAGSLADLLATSASSGGASAPFSHSVVTLVLRQVAEGLAFLHANRVTHRDLKPANVLVRGTEPLVLALADFGLAGLGGRGGEGVMRGVCGTVFYSAPELLGGGPYTEVVDVWSMGVVGIEMVDVMLTGLTADVAMDYPRGIAARAKAMYERSSWPVLEIVNNMLRWQGSDRPTAAECLDDLDQLLKLERPSLAELATLARSGGHGPSPEQVRYFAMGAGATVRPAAAAPGTPIGGDGYGRSPDPIRRSPQGTAVW
ncbi:kinase-like domain-containing protein [Chaetomium tenue]|uniref:Kinase-like domain-containing protein n=1 Tax=Chaetomium tenue TaxID=1854479 RepID=A0ACB7NX72_9PEZI|nr:kinase-like domain-containing protein [Chaetomium globosum]